MKNSALISVLHAYDVYAQLFQACRYLPYLESVLRCTLVQSTCKHTVQWTHRNVRRALHHRKLLWQLMRGMFDSSQKKTLFAIFPFLL